MSEKNMEWINARQTTPQPCQYILAAVPDLCAYTIITAEVISDKVLWTPLRNCYLKMEEVDYWLPIPKPPEFKRYHYKV